MTEIERTKKGKQKKKDNIKMEENDITCSTTARLESMGRTSDTMKGKKIQHMQVK